MPPKRTREELKKKQEIAAKVKEIKDRQQKWLNEKKEFDEGKHSESHTFANRDIEDERDSRNSFHSYNQKPTFNSPPGHSDILEQISPERNHVERWLEHSSSSTPDQLASSISSYRPGIYETPPQSTDDYNVVADRIIDRVKNKLGVSHGHSTLATESYRESSSKPLPAHLCPKCQKLMRSPHHSPMMLIPCGHNLCEACCRGAVSCYTCDTEISSLTSNIMLQQIILSKSGGQATPTVNKQSSHSKALDRAEDEIQTLILRRDAMGEEKSNIRHKISQINNYIEKEAAQKTSIENQESSIIREISQLQKKLTVLYQHKEEFRGKITSYHTDIESEHKKLNLIDETTSYLSDRLRKLGHKS